MLPRRTYFLASIPIWAIFAITIYVNWPALVLRGGAVYPDSPELVAGVGVLLLGLLMLVIQSKLGDYIVSDPIRDGESPTTEQIRAQAELAAEKALRRGDKMEAMSIYEASGMFSAALTIAQELGDRVSVARLFTQIGRFVQARKIYVENDDNLSAAYVSGLMGDIEAARSFYANVARERDEVEEALPELAGLWDRAGEREKAARLYEEAGDFECAEECYAMIGDEERARQCASKRSALRAYERRQSSDAPRPIGPDRRTELYKEDLGRSAELFEKLGDFFEAGMVYRRIGKMGKAGAAFERFEEWERAARCYAADGEKAKALEMRRRMPEIEVQAQPQQPADAPMAASAGQTQPALTHNVPAQPVILVAPAVPTAVVGQQAVPFIPIAANEPIPIFYLPSPGAAASAETPALREVMGRLAGHLRQGHFREAADEALASHEWLMAAALYEQAGDLLKAAEIYREIGSMDEAIACVRKAGRLHDAALLELALGREEQAIEVLASAATPGSEPEIGQLLCKLLIRTGNYDKALQILEKVLAPGGISKGNALLHYEFACLLAEHGAVPESVRIFDRLLAAGVLTPQLEKLVIEFLPDAGVSNTSSAVPPPTPLVGSEAESPAPSAKLTAMDFLLAAIKDSNPAQLDPDTDNDTESITPPPTAATLDAPPGIAGRSLRADPGGLHLNDKFAPTGAGREVSLFGRPDAGVVANSSAPINPAPGTSESKGARTEPIDPFRLSRRYEIVKELARGGMGIVFEATDTVLGRGIALKLIQYVGAKAAQIQQFLLEARAIARLSHPNVITIYDVGLLDLQHYIAMELVRGGTLKDWIAHEKSLSLKDAMGVFIEIARGLQAAHEAGIIHRDIKPGNILLTPKRDVKIVDFGLAKLAASPEKDTDQSTIFRGAGTPGYMPPEQFRAEPLGPPCDIYALGITLYQMLIGAPPYATAGLTNRWDIMQFQLTGSQPRISDNRRDVPAAIEQIYENCTAPDPKNRFQSVEQILPAAEQWFNAL
ncbi:MAG: protein kinase [Candidatus Sumerlaeaceae bacterium]|nr:protein kinase [Candidatus Sumerlaeaceae bacterium]